MPKLRVLSAKEVLDACQGTRQSIGVQKGAGGICRGIYLAEHQACFHKREVELISAQLESILQTSNCKSQQVTHVGP